VGIKLSVESLASFAHLGWRGRAQSSRGDAIRYLFGKVATSVPASHERAKAEPTRRFVHAKDLVGIKLSVESLASFAHLGWRGRHPLPVFTTRSLRSNPLSGWVGKPTTVSPCRCCLIGLVE